MASDLGLDLTRHTDLPAQIIEARRALRLSQVDLARTLGVAANTVNRWEAGTRAIPSFLWLAFKGIEHTRTCECESNHE